MRGDLNGTVIRPASEVLKHPGRWSYMEIEVKDVLYEKAVRWAHCMARDNKGYNKRMIASFFNPFKKRIVTDDDMYICSVAVQGWHWVLDMFDDWYIWSPLKLWYKLDEMGYKTVRMR